MTNLYILEYQKQFFDEVGDDTWDYIRAGEEQLECFYDECKFNSRITELNKEFENDWSGYRYKLKYQIVPLDLKEWG